MSSDSLLSLRSTPYTCNLSEDLLKKARDELSEVPSRRQEDIQHLRDWLNKQPHIRSRTDDRFLLMFLRGCKFSLERAKEKLDIFHTLKTHCPEMLGGGDPLDKETQRVLQCGGFVPLPKPLPNGQRLVIIRVAARDVESVTQESMFRVSNMIAAFTMEEDEGSQICGVVGILDLKDATLSHAVAMTPSLVKKAVTCWDACPVRQKGMHYYNSPPGIDPVLNLFKSFMKEKLRQRIHVHGMDQKSLHAAIPPECLPEEYGGTLGKIADIHSANVKKMEANRDFFLDAMKWGVDEKKRQGRPKTVADLFGIEGSFRKLDID